MVSPLVGVGALGRPNTATISPASLCTLRRRQPRRVMSPRQPMSFSHSEAGARNTRMSARSSQEAGYGEPEGVIAPSASKGRIGGW